MVEACCVEGCDALPYSVTYFKFPNSHSLKKKWLEAVDVVGKVTVNSIVCSAHFLETDYEFIRGKTRLKGKVVPSVKCKSEKLQQPTARIEESSESCDQTQENSNTDPPDKHSNINPKEVKETGSAIDKEKCDEAIDRVNGDIAIEKVNGDIATEKANCDINIEKANGDETSRKSQESRTSVLENYAEEPTKVEINVPKFTENIEDQDIEDILTNYHIPQNKKLAELPQNKNITDALHNVTDAINNLEADLHSEVVDLDKVVACEPTYIEVATGRDISDESARDCLMLMEDVQVMVDPALLMRDEDDDDDDVQEVEVKENPISLLTSSDDDDVILEEPHIDTVEVSDETDEDDVPLVRLVKTKPKSKNKVTITMFKYNKYGNKNDVQLVSRALHVCGICSYTTSSKTQYSKHKKKHKEDKIYKCHLCPYTAKHHMSLLYHMKTHCSSIDLCQLKCPNCSYTTSERSKLTKHQKCCRSTSRYHQCDYCSYGTDRRSDLKRHLKRKHNDVSDDDDDEYVPNKKVLRTVN